MITVQTLQRISSRWPLGCLLLFAAAVMPRGVVNAQDFEAIEKRLGEAIAEREISIEQAAVMLEALRGSAAGGNGDEYDKGDVEGQLSDWVESVGDKLKAAVEEGSLSKEDAWGKWHYFKENELAPKLKAAVKSGKLSEEAAMHLWKELAAAEAKEKGKPGEKSANAQKSAPDWETIKRKIEGAVEAGKMTREEANEYYASVKHRMAAASGKPQGKSDWQPSREEIAEVEQKIKAAVEAGKLTKEQARERMEAHLKSLRQKSDSQK